MAIALETIVKQLEDSGIVAAGKLKDFVPPNAHPKSAEELVSELVKQNHLTKFQAQQVAQGKSKALILGGYTILDKIGAGGMGQVFKAQHRRMKRVVAIKMLPAAMMKDAAAAARFQREVEAAAKLNHSNIVTAYDADEANGAHFLVMEYVEGKDLSATVKKNGPFPVAKAVNYILQAARGLEFAHKKGVVHRDIKPANLLLDNEGVVKILDMGLARIESAGEVANQAELTGTGAVMGTVDYMAPEQALSTRHADARADIYSLGCSLYYLIAGKPTFGGETMTAKLLAHQAEAVPQLRQVHEDVSAELEAVFNKMMEKKIEDRYQTMTAVIADLEQCSSGQATSLSIQQSGTTNLDNSALTFFKNLQATPTIQKTKATRQVASTKPSEDKQPPWKNTKVLIGAGAAGLLFLLLGIWVIIRDKDGKEVAKVQVPDGGSVNVQEVKQSPFAKAAKKLEVGPKTNSPFKSGSAPGNLFIHDPAFQKWMKDVAALSADKQLIEVARKFQELNPGFDGTLTNAEGNGTPVMTLGVVTELGFIVDNVADISPVRALPGLKKLSCQGGRRRDATKLIDLSPLKGMALTDFRCPKANVSDLSALTGMPLVILDCEGTNVSNITPLRGMPMISLNCISTKVADLSPLNGMQQLRSLTCSSSQVSDLSPLEGCKSLKILHIKGNPKITAANVAALQKALPNCKITWDDPAKATTPQPAVPVGPQPPVAKAPFDAAQAKAHQEAWAKHLGMRVEYENSLGMKFVLIPPGEFLMGDDPKAIDFDRLKIPDKARPGFADLLVAASPRHTVKITRPFYLQTDEVTVGQYQTLVGNLPPENDPTRPNLALSRYVTLADGVAFCNALSNREGKTRAYQTEAGITKRVLAADGYRLPSEAEWEYACRAGTTTPWFFGDNPHGPNGDSEVLLQYQNFMGVPARPNPFGLYLMYAGASELCYDLYRSYRSEAVVDPFTEPSDGRGVVRGGSGYSDGGKDVATINSFAHTPGKKNTDDSKWHGLGRVLLPIPDRSLPPPAKAPFDAAQAKAHQEAWARHLGTTVETVNSVGAKLVLIPPGEFMMGSTDEQVSAFNGVKGEQPSHRVVITKPFLMGATEVTVGEFKKFAAATGYKTEAEKGAKDAEAKTYLNPGCAATDDMPVTHISWNDAVAYCQWLSGQEKATYRLPTEAEWEYACRAGTTTPYFFGVDAQGIRKYGWYKDNVNPNGTLGPAGKQLPNPFGLHDVHGNVWEWCGDFYDEKWYEKSPVNDPTGPESGSHRVLRGGYTSYSGFTWRSAYRIAGAPTSSKGKANNWTGFRCVRVFDGSTPLTASAPVTTASAAPQSAVPVAAAGKLFIHDPAFQQWMKDVQAMPADKQIEAVSKKLMELNPGFDGKLTGDGTNPAPTIENGVVTQLRFISEDVSDISPVRALAGLQVFRFDGSGHEKCKISDLSPLQGMKLAVLNCGDSQVSDLSPLEGMKLSFLICAGTPVSDLSPLVGMKLTYLRCNHTRISDLSPLREMPVTQLFCDHTAISDLSPLQDCKSLTAVHVEATKVTAAGVAALQNALPNCKIEWDDPAKAKTIPP